MPSMGGLRGTNQVEPAGAGAVAINVVEASADGLDLEVGEEKPKRKSRSFSAGVVVKVAENPATTQQRTKSKSLHWVVAGDGSYDSNLEEEDDSFRTDGSGWRAGRATNNDGIRREKLKSDDGHALRSYGGGGRHAFSAPTLKRPESLSRWSLQDSEAKSSLGKRRKSFMIHYKMSSEAEIPHWDLLGRFRVMLWARLTPYRIKIRQYLAEFLGTLVLVSFGTAVVAQVLLSDGSFGGHLSISIGWGLAVMIGGYIAGGVSGAHLNPAVSFALALYNRHPFEKVPGYILAQLLGAFFGSLISYANYSTSLNAYAMHNNITNVDLRLAKIFTTFPSPEVSQAGAFLNEFLASAFLFVGILAVNDGQNLVPGSNMGPLIIGLTVTLVALSFGSLTGFSVNPARDLGPRMAMAAAGFGLSVFTGWDYYWWIPPLASFTGMVFGGALYFTFVSCETEKESENGNNEL